MKQENYLYGMSEKEAIGFCKRMMKKVRSHGDSEESSIEFQKQHPEFKYLPWLTQKKMLKKRFPYLTDIELNFLGRAAHLYEGEL